MHFVYGQGLFQMNQCVLSLDILQNHLEWPGA